MTARSVTNSAQKLIPHKVGGRPGRKSRGLSGRRLDQVVVGTQCNMPIVKTDDDAPNRRRPGPGTPMLAMPLVRQLTVDLSPGGPSVDRGIDTAGTAKHLARGTPVAILADESRGGKSTRRTPI